MTLSSRLPVFALVILLTLAPNASSQCLDEETVKLLPAALDDGDLFGRSVAIRDGLACVGASFDDSAGLDTGSAYLYRFNGAEMARHAHGRRCRRLFDTVRGSTLHAGLRKERGPDRGDGLVPGTRSGLHVVPHERRGRPRVVRILGGPDAAGR